MATAPFFLPTMYRPVFSSRAALIKALLKTWLPVLLFACIFAVESTAPFGADHTNGPLHSLARGVVGAAADHNWSYTHHILRKIGHFSGYGMFSVVCFRAFWMSFRSRIGRLRMGIAMQGACHGLALAATFLVASADEFHQSFLPNRTGNFGDVLLDMSGALSLQIALLLAIRMFAWWQARQGQGAMAPSSFGLARRLSLRRRRTGLKLIGRAVSGYGRRRAQSRQNHQRLDLLHG